MQEPRAQEPSRRPIKSSLPWIIVMAAVLAFDLLALSGEVRNVDDLFAWITEEADTPATTSPAG